MSPLRRTSTLAALLVTAAVAQSAHAAEPDPSVRLVSPTPGEHVAGPVQIRAEASATRGVSRVQFMIDGRSIGVDRVAPYEMTWDSSTGPAGLYAVRAFAYDTAGIRSPLARAEVVAGSPATALWSGGYETGDLSQWSDAYSNVYSVAPDRIQVAASDADGPFAARFEVRQGDKPVTGGDRAEVAMFNRVANGMDAGSGPRWYSWQTMLPPDYAPSQYWQTLAQWHQSSSASGPSPLKLSLARRSSEFRLAGRSVPGAPETVLYAAPATRGVWHSFVLGVQWSPSPSEGWVELWHNGVKVLGRTARPTQYARQDGTPIPNAFKQGLYRSGEIAFPQAVFHRGARLDVVPPE